MRWYCHGRAVLAAAFLAIPGCFEGSGACGNGVVNDNEECDDGASNSDTESGACRTNCTLPTCGDCVIDPGEVCDDACDGISEGPCVPVCAASCSLVVWEAICGDGIVCLSESCDDGAQNGTGNGFCLADCSSIQTCGDGITNGTEICDDGANNGTGEGLCVLDCSRIQSCGDDAASGTEDCDGTDLQGARCYDFGYGGGEVGCDANCDFDLSDCADTCSTWTPGTLPCVSVRFPPGQQTTFTQTEALTSVSIAYEVIVQQDVTNVIPELQEDGCCGPGKVPLFVFERLYGNGQLYCLCDFGLCQPQPCASTSSPSYTIPAGVYPLAFDWEGNNWIGPSDFNNQPGPPFPAGTYALDVSIRGYWLDPIAAGSEAYFMVWSLSVEVVP